MINMSNEELAIRKDYVGVLTPLVGAKKGSAIHLDIVDTYSKFCKTNTVTWGGDGYPRKSAMTDYWAWCAATASYPGIKKGYAMKVTPVEMSCTRLIVESKAHGIWEEDESNEDAYQIGNWIIYDWEDGTSYKNKDNRGDPNHVGIIYDVNVKEKYCMVVEGNMNNAIGTRKLAFDGRYIRGIICPKFSELVGKVEVKPTTTPTATNTVVENKTTTTTTTNSATEEKKVTIITTEVKSGSKGEKVKRVQILLNALNNAGLEVDGSFGKLTKAAVVAYQKANPECGTADGIVGPKTWNKLING